MKKIINTFKYGTSGVKRMLFATIFSGLITVTLFVAAIVTSVMVCFFGGIVMFFITVALAQTMGIREDYYGQNEINEKAVSEKPQNPIVQGDNMQDNGMFGNVMYENGMPISNAPENDALENDSLNNGMFGNVMYENGMPNGNPAYNDAENTMPMPEMSFEYMQYNNMPTNDMPRNDIIENATPENYDDGPENTDKKERKKKAKKEKNKKVKTGEEIDIIEETEKIPKPKKAKKAKKIKQRETSKEETNETVNSEPEAPAMENKISKPEIPAMENEISKPEIPANNIPQNVSAEVGGITEEIVREYNNKKKIKKTLHKYKVKHDHRMVMVDHCDKLKILQTPAYIWADKNIFNLLLIESEPRLITFPLYSLNQITYLKKQPANEYAEYAAFRSERGVLVELFKPYLPEYTHSTVVNDMTAYKNLYGIGPGIYFTNTSASSLFDLLAAEFVVKDKVTESNKVNVYFKEAYKANIKLRDNVLDANGYADSISSVLENLAKSTVSYNEFKETLNLLIKNKLITQEFAMHYMDVRDKFTR